MSHKVFSVTMSVVAGIVLMTILISSVNAAENLPRGETGRAILSSDALPADCRSCHGKSMLAQGHINTQGLSLKECRLCHQESLQQIKNSMPSDHPHQFSNVTCKDCHGNADPPQKTGTDVCLQCHDIKEIVQRSSGGKNDPNPHDSPHYGTSLDCSECHYQHGRSKLLCAKCHPYEFVTPSPVIPYEYARTIPREKNMNCLVCHTKARFAENFTKTSHGGLCCSDCHKDINDIRAHIRGDKKPGKVSCAICHYDVVNLYIKSYHYLVGRMRCESCHTDIHPDEVKLSNFKIDVINRCNHCHQEDEYVDLVSLGHAGSVLKGNEDAATCSDCHGLHKIPRFRAKPEDNILKSQYYTNKCIACHSDEEIAKRNKLLVSTAEKFKETYHGKVHFMGYSQRNVGCPDCHTPHNILPKDDPGSPINPANLIETCGRCHKGFHPRFVSFTAHPDDQGPPHYRAFYISRLFMILLLAWVLLFFWIHLVLWWRKDCLEKIRDIRMADPRKETDISHFKATGYVRRFILRDRIMHILLILSFFGAAASGLPLKYYNTPWAGVLIDFLGGAKYAGIIHRISATIMLFLFLYGMWRVLKFLFTGKEGAKELSKRLFGPDSLFPNRKDFKDIAAMFRWFVDKGEMPEFERWTYWEKFNFLAVFCWMFVAGTTGIMLWLPEMTSYVLPGWLIDVAAIVHSGQALPAAVFIFMVHFFNNHFVPGKFPMEMNIFTGRYPLENLKRQHSMEYERIVADGRLEEVRCGVPGILTQFLASVFGLFCLALGTGLTILIFWAVFFY